jgi:hypothetical protein
VYKNSFSNIYVGQQFLSVNAGLLTITGLQTLCNTFNDNQFRDILVGGISTQIIPCCSSIRPNQGSKSLPAGNQFSQNNIFNFESQSQDTINYYYYSGNTIENPSILGKIKKLTSNIQNSCPSHSIAFDTIITRDKGIRGCLSLYDEWNEQYEYWLAKLLAANEGDEEYPYLLDMVSYYSALKDNYFNSIIVEEMNNYELQITNYETLRFLFQYRGQYYDYLSITETYLAENNYREALATISTMYDKFKLSEEQVDELTSLQGYIRWLQQIEAREDNIYNLLENDINYLVHFVETNTGRGKVFANNILCELYGICLDEAGGMRDEVGGLRDEVGGMGDEVGDLSSASSACSKALENITLVPNPTTGELTITNYK